MSFKTSTSIAALVFLFLTASMSAWAYEDKEPAKKKKEIDEYNYCYYGDKEYSKGSRLEMPNGRVSTCVVGNDRKLVWN